MAAGGAARGPRWCSLSLAVVWLAGVLLTTTTTTTTTPTTTAKRTMSAVTARGGAASAASAAKASSLAALSRTPGRWMRYGPSDLGFAQRRQRRRPSRVRAGTKSDETLPDDFKLEDYLDNDESQDPELKPLPHGQEADQVADRLDGRGLESIYGPGHEVEPIEDLGHAVWKLDAELERAGAPIVYPPHTPMVRDSNTLRGITLPEPKPGQFKNNTVMMMAHPLEVGWDDPETELLDRVNLTEVYEMDRDTSGYDEIERGEVAKFQAAIAKLMAMMPAVETDPTSALLRHPHLAEGYPVPKEMQIDDRFSSVYQAEQVVKAYNLTEFNLDDIMYAGIQTPEKLRARRKRKEAKRIEEGLAPTEVDFRWRYDGDLGDISHDMVDKMNFKQLRAILALHATEERFSGIDTRRNGTWDDLKNRMHTVLDAHKFQSRIERQKQRKWALTKVAYTQQRLLYILEMQKEMYPYGEYYELGMKRLGAMEEWVGSTGCYVSDGLKLVEEELFEERSVCAKEEIDEGDMLVMIRTDNMITSQVARSSPIGGYIEKRCPNITHDYYIMAAFLCQERCKEGDSFWSQYIETLPKKMFSLPTRYPPEAGGEILRGTYAGYFIENKAKQAVRAYDYLSKGLPLNIWKRKIPLEMFLWAVSVCESRAYKLRVAPDVTLSALVPYADMLNADANDPNAEFVYDEDLGAMVVNAIKPIKPEEEVRISYGTFSNTHWFVQYGLLFPLLTWKSLLKFGDDTAFAVTNSYDDEAVQMMFSHLRRKQQDLSGLRSIIAKDYEAMEQTRYELTPDIKEKRLSLYDSLRDKEETLGELEEQEMIYNSGDYAEAMTVIEYRRSLDPANISATSLKGEITVLRELKATALEQVKLQGSTIEDDVEYLRDLDLDREEGNIDVIAKTRKMMMVKVAEKHILKYFVDLADFCIPMLQMKRGNLKEYRKMMKKANRKGETPPYYSYISTVVLPLIKQRCELQDLRRKGLLPQVDTSYDTRDETNPKWADGELPLPWKVGKTLNNLTVYWNAALEIEQWERPTARKPKGAQEALALSMQSRYVQLASTWKPIQLEGPDGLNKMANQLELAMYGKEEVFQPPPILDPRPFQWEDERHLLYEEEEY